MINVCRRASAWITQSWVHSWKQTGWCPACGGASGESSKPWGKQLWKPEDLLSTSGMLAQEHPRKQRSEDAIVQLLQQWECTRWQDTEVPSHSGNGRQGETSWIQFAIWCLASATVRASNRWYDRNVQHHATRRRVDLEDPPARQSEFRYNNPALRWWVIWPARDTYQPWEISLWIVAGGVHVLLRTKNNGGRI